MRTSEQITADCNCDIRIRTYANRIEYFDVPSQLWQPLYPDFRLYPYNATIITLMANDGRNLTIRSGCSVSINGTVYTDFVKIYDALNAALEPFFFNPIVIFPYGTTAQRPVNPAIGQVYLDTDYGYPIIWNGSNWINFDGAVV